MPEQNKNGVNPTTSQPQSVKSFGEHKTPQPTKKVEPCKSLNEAMTMFQQLAVKATKDSSNPFFKSSYADLSAVINAVGEAAQFGLSFTQIVHYENTILTDGEHKQYMYRDLYVETVVSHNTDDNKLVSRIPIIVADNKKSDPQAMGSAITYAKRYALQAIYGLATEDDDANSASGKTNSNIPILSTKTTNHQSSRNGGF
tara:strand:- start:416 stop:1015 length:600 start_codon:yes stop_codon:yes gene_type:complete